MLPAGGLPENLPTPTNSIVLFAVLCLFVFGMISRSSRNGGNGSAATTDHGGGKRRGVIIAARRKLNQLTPSLKEASRQKEDENDQVDRYCWLRLSRRNFGGSNDTHADTSAGWHDHTGGLRLRPG